jgi:hypothetical protein
VSLSRHQLQLIRWTSATLCGAIVVSSWFLDIHGGWAALWFFSFLLVGAPAALITLHLMDTKSKAERH